MDKILHHTGALNYRRSEDFRDLRWCKISCINRSILQLVWPCLNPMPGAAHAPRRYFWLRTVMMRPYLQVGQGFRVKFHWG